MLPEKNAYTTPFTTPAKDAECHRPIRPPMSTGQRIIVAYSEYGDVLKTEATANVKIRSPDKVNCRRMALHANGVTADMTFFAACRSILAGKSSLQSQGQIRISGFVLRRGAMPRLPADIRISLKRRGGKTDRIELVRNPFKQRFWVRRNGRRSARLRTAISASRRYCEQLAEDFAVPRGGLRRGCLR